MLAVIVTLTFKLLMLSLSNLTSVIRVQKYVDRSEQLCGADLVNYFKRVYKRL